MDLSELAIAERWRLRWHSSKLSSDFVKIFMDGVIESATALMLEDYVDRPGTRGTAFFEAQEFDALCIEADKLGFQIAVHAIGDAAVRRTLDGYAAARRANGIRDSRHRVEHIETLHSSDLPRFAELGVIASMQTTHAAGGHYPLEPVYGMIGRERSRTAFAWRTIRDAEARIAFSSDWPVAPLNPMLGIKWALCKPPYPGAPDQRQTLMEALASYTRDGAYAEFSENDKGVLKSGALADVAVLSRNIEKTAPEEIDQIAVAMTICDGSITHEAPR